MKKKFLKQMMTILCWSGMLVVCAAEVEPVASWAAAPGDAKMIYDTKGTVKGHHVNDKSIIYTILNQDSKPEICAYFSKYYYRFKAELPKCLWEKKGDFTVLGKIRLSNVEKSDPRRSPVIFSMQRVALLVNRGGNSGGKGQLSFNVYGKSSRGGNKGGHRAIDSRIRVDDGQWHNFAVCINNNRLMMWVDGKKIPNEKVMDELSNPLPFKRTLEIGGAAKGLWISNMHFYNCALPEKVILRKTASPGKVILKKNAHDVLKETITLSKGVKPHAELFQVKAVSKEMRLPYVHPSDAVKTDTLRLVATPGEYEPVSFVVHAKTNLPQVIINASDLKCKSETINSKNIDIKLVKCWYQAGTAWDNIGAKPNIRVLTPELMLNDDSLVKVDYELRRNYIKLKTGNTIKYVEMTSTTRKGQPGMNNDQFPVKDSAELLPFSLKNGLYKQIWVTVHVPKNSKAGIYTGKVSLTSNGTSIGNFNLRLRVLPFTLAAPKTFYNLNKTFTSSIYYKGVLAKKGTLTGWFKTEEQYRADLKNMVAHGVTSPVIHELQRAIKYRRKKDFKDFERAIRIRKELGISIDPLYLLGPERNIGLENTSDPQKIDKAVAYLRKVLAVTKKHGIKTVYVYGIDEAVGSKLANQKHIWEEFKKTGAKLYTAGFMKKSPKAYELGKYIDVFVNHGPLKKKWAQQWHNQNSMIWSYSNPQGGVENPRAYRRGFGFPLWMANYDGACTYIYNHGYGHTWNDFDHNKWRDHNLTYPTINGVIDTIAWEGYREGIDDIRYGTTLKEHIAKALAGNDSGKKAIAEKAQNWLNTIHDNENNMSTMRLQIIKWILKLQ